MKKSIQTQVCPCGSNRTFLSCCNRFLLGREKPQTVLELMRSRYTAYTRHDVNYIRHTWYPSSRPKGLMTTDKSIKWIRLQIIRHEEANNDGLVEFIAYCKVNGRAQKMHETSRFLKEEGQWYYLDGTFNQ